MFQSEFAKRRVILRALAPLLLVFVGAPLARTQCRRTPSDTTFAPQGAQTGEQYGGGAPVFSSTMKSPFSGYANYQIPRVVGPGTATEFDQNGFLTAASWNTYVQNGVLSKTAWLDVGQIIAIGLSAPPASLLQNHAVTLYVNDIPVPSYSYTFAGRCLEFPTQYLKFPQRVPGQPLNPAQAPVNKIAFTLDSPDLFNDPGDFPACCGIQVGNLTIQAMAPVIMVHGYNSGPWWWGPSPSGNPTPDNPDACGPDTDPNDIMDGNRNFIQTFVNAKIPFSCTVQLYSYDSVPDGASELKQIIPEVASEFGVHHVHLIGHSKGGLWIRAALPWLADNGPGIYSVTTLDTPHHGSALADLQVAAHEKPLLNLFDYRKFLAQFRRYHRSAEKDLQTLELQDFNTHHPDPANTLFRVQGTTNYAQYYSVAADADLNNDGNIAANEASPYPHVTVENNLYHYLGTKQTFNVSSVLTFGKAAPTSHSAPVPAFMKNDLVVTIYSAQYEGFLPIVPDTPYSGTIPYFLYNHRTVGDPLISQKLIVLMQYAETHSQQPEQQ